MQLEVKSLETGKTRTLESAAIPALEIAFRHGQCGCTYYARDAGSGRPWLVIDLVRYGATLDTAATERRILEALRARGWNVRRGRMTGESI